MKNTFWSISLFLIIWVSSCTGYINSDQQIEVKDSLGYKKMVGTYVFKPSAEQAERLKLDTNELITLRITTDSLLNKSGRYTGKYFIDKMILMPNSSVIGAYSSTWQYYYSDITKANWLEFHQPYQTNNDLEYRVERSANNDTLHIAAYADDVKYEIMRLIDFKKVK